MARISEFEIFEDDQVEIAITQAEYDAMIASGSTFRVDLYYFDGTVADNNPALEFTDWTFDPDTAEWVSFVSVGPTSMNNFSPGNLSTGNRYHALGLYNDDGGTITGHQYIGISNAPESAFAAQPVDGPLAGTGVTLEYYNFSSLPNDSSAGQDSIRWDAQNPNNPFRSDPSLGESGTAPICFCEQTRIQTPRGLVPIEQLLLGDVVVCKSGNHSIRWIGKRHIGLQELKTNPKARPVRITASSLGHRVPSTDLLVSRQHRIAVSSPIANRIFGTADVLVPAHVLTQLPGVFIDETMKELNYFHLLFDDHQIIFADGTPAESLYFGPQVFKSLSRRALTEIRTVVPKLRTSDYAPVPGFVMCSNGQSRDLISGHLENNIPLLDTMEIPA